MVFKEVGTGLPPVWKPEKKGDFIEGIYHFKKLDVGENNANMYYIKDVKTGEITSIWGSTVLDDKMNIHANLGDVIRVTYLGKVKKYHDYKLEKDKPEQD